MEEIDLVDLGFEEGGYLMVKHALRRLGPGAELRIAGSAPELGLHLSVWCRQEGHVARPLNSGPGTSLIAVVAGRAQAQRWARAQRAGGTHSHEAGAVVDRAPPRWGLAARGATVEAGTPEFNFTLLDKLKVWDDDVGRLYTQAAAAQWDPCSVIPWSAPFELAAEVEDAVVQVMTYLVENETAALIVPARFLAQIHPHFREVLQLLAVQSADEARHVKVFSRRACFRRAQLGLSTASGQASLKTLIDEGDFAIASFLLSVMGEGSFLSLLGFLAHCAPDPITEAATRMAAQDEGRHIGFAMGRLRAHLNRDPALRARLAAAVRARHEALRHTAGLNAEVFDALIVVAAGTFEPSALRRGYRRVMELIDAMDQGRRKRLMALGFDAAAAAELSSLHTRNFM